ncbi:hypothetical protein CEXT_467331 [Caerostris extrusa]|uniref:Uncharacterized protein n=1 Tax=Caerostris extrusa TaxID=172846 RepID=A0AAV4S307_CAEEX|nr:hypothetical protein CEXT_467331 [Caerostris extrusa]
MPGDLTFFSLLPLQIAKPLEVHVFPSHAFKVNGKKIPDLFLPISLPLPLLIEAFRRTNDQEDIQVVQTAYTHLQNCPILHTGNTAIHYLRVPESSRTL